MTISEWLVAVDLQQATPSVVRTAAAFVKGHHVGLRLAHATAAAPTTPAKDVPREVRTAYEAWSAQLSARRARAEGELASLRDQQIADGVPTTVSMLDGSPVDRLLAAAEAPGIVGTVVGHHVSGSSKVLDLLPRWLGSTADRIVRRSKKPVLLATHPYVAPSSPQVWVVGVDLSDAAAFALRTAIKLAATHHATLYAVYAHAPLGMSEFDADTAQRAVAWDAALRHNGHTFAERAMQDWLTRLGPAAAAVHSVVREGEPMAMLTDVAHEQRASMLVVGTHGRTAAQRWILGSVTERVLRHADVPVLVIPSHPDQR